MKLSQTILATAIALSLGLAGCGDNGGGSPPPGDPTPTPGNQTFTVPNEAVPSGAQKKDITLPDGLKGLLVDSAGGATLASYAGFGIPVPDKFLSAAGGSSNLVYRRASVQPVVVYAGSSMAMKTANADVSTIAQQLLSDMKTYLGQGTLASGGFDLLVNQSIKGPQGVIAVRLVDLTLTAQQTVASLRQSLINNILGQSQSGLPTIAVAQAMNFRLTLAVFIASDNKAYMWLGVYPASQQNKAAAYGGLSNGTALTVSNQNTRKSNTDQFSQGQATGAADLLLVIDNSGSMSEEQTNVADTAGLLFSKLGNSSLDFHLGVARTGNQSGLGPCYELSQTTTGARFIEPSTPNGTVEFEGISQPGASGSSTETGLFCAEQTFADTGGVNGNFDRASAPNVVLILSDEPEHETVDKDMPDSPPTGYTQQDLTHYVNYFTQTTPATVFTIVGTSTQTRMTFSDPEPGSGPDYSCSGPGGNAAGGANYGAISQATGGSRASICVGSANYDTLMNRLVATATGLGSQFTLVQTPIAGTVQVTVNGNTVSHDPSHSNGFDVIYSISGASVVFYGSAIPSAGDAIVVAYEYIA